MMIITITIINMLDMMIMIHMMMMRKMSMMSMIMVMVMMFVVMGLILLVGSVIARRATVIPSGKAQGLAEALSLGSAEQEVDVRLFGKPTTRKNRRMGVALATGTDTDDARARARQAADKVTIRYL